MSAWCRLDYDSANNTWRKKIRQGLCVCAPFSPSLSSSSFVVLFRRYPSSSSSSSGVELRHVNVVRTQVCKGVVAWCYFSQTAITNYFYHQHLFLWIFWIQICEYKWEIIRMRNERNARARMNQLDFLFVPGTFLPVFLFSFGVVGNRSRGIRIQIR
jgi:hypothetical protein